MTEEYKDTTEAAIASTRIITDSCVRSQTVKRLIYTASVIDFFLAYIKSKTLAEKEVLSYNEIQHGKLEVVSLACALVGGDILLSYLPATCTLSAIISQLTSNLPYYNALRFLQEFLGSIPLLHIDDVCEAHIFCMEKQSLRGRFICENYPQLRISPE
ncbi:hypothetical protein HYC85_026559 [Camellia sinensis]|uniref:NAD-dependent epimerase/dehydratase domain-containing protein n=1 Tax=Camellia sinensis TaxID=4442 RepID=A0A7J7G3X5_CAMSI|nr:hypothetical protein HYC85_026559 [Camellia sinensis]